MMSGAPTRSQSRLTQRDSGTNRLALAGNLAQQGRRDQPVKRHDDGKIGPAEPVMGLDQGGEGALPDAFGGGHIDHDAKVEMAVVEAGNQTIRGFAQHWKDPY